MKNIPFPYSWSGFWSYLNSTLEFGVIPIPNDGDDAGAVPIILPMWSGPWAITTRDQISCVGNLSLRHSKIFLRKWDSWRPRQETGSLPQPPDCRRVRATRPTVQAIRTTTHPTVPAACASACRGMLVWGFRFLHTPSETMYWVRPAFLYNRPPEGDRSEGFYIKKSIFLDFH